MENIFTRIDADALEKMLKASSYPRDKTQYLVEGFKNGFSLKFEGNRQGKHEAGNLKLRIGSEEILWNKVMKEVAAKRYTGPWAHLPLDYWYCNPIGLVPKGENKDQYVEGTRAASEIDPSNCRLIFHLSYEFPEVGSVNGGTPSQECTVEYQGIDDAVKKAMQFDSPYLSKTDGVSAFSHLPVRKEDWNLMVMKAKCPQDGKWYYFCSKVIGFGHSISCRLFTEFMQSLIHVTGTRCDQGEPIFYLDDVICIDGSQVGSNHQLTTYMGVCAEVNYPLSPEKTIWATQVIVFLGMLLDAIRRIICIPVDKRDKALTQI